jgi:DNA-binding transcriptional MocR family regulator
LKQLDLSSALDGVLGGDYHLNDGTDARNYGGLRGIPEARALGAELLGVPIDAIIAGGNSSLSLMYLTVETALNYGVAGAASAWRLEAEASGGTVKFLCPVPGYDRHFTVTESLGIEMIPIPMGSAGPDLDAVNRAVEADPLVKGIWCVPKYSNPTGCVYADKVVDALAALPQRTGANFLIMWDNAYAVHDLVDPAPRLANLYELARDKDTSESVALFASTSKITFAGAGLSFVAGAPNLLDGLEKRLFVQTIGPDKVNQLRHARFLVGRLAAHMRAHAELIAPKFETVKAALEKRLGGLGVATWTEPEGGYFISVDTLPGLAQDVVELAATAGVKLTPAGATFPYGKDPDNKNIRLAPTYPSLEEVEAATETFAVCVELVSCRELLKMPKETT